MELTRHDVDPGSAILAPSIDHRHPLTCQSCGADVQPPTFGSPDQTVTTLLAVCDVLVVNALERMGNYIVRAERRRFLAIGDRPLHLAHTLWPANDAQVSKALKRAWDAVPTILATHYPIGIGGEDVVQVLDEYVHDLGVTGERHTFNTLAYRLRTELGLPTLPVAADGR